MSMIPIPKQAPFRSAAEDFDPYTKMSDMLTRPHNKYSAGLRPQDIRDAYHAADLIAQRDEQLRRMDIELANARAATYLIENYPEMRLPINTVTTGRISSADNKKLLLLLL